MIRFGVVVIGLMISATVSGQIRCDVKTLSSQEKVLLQTFCSNLKAAVANNNKHDLAKLFKFPFTCSYCGADSTHPYVRVSRELFLSTFYKEFFTNNFIETLNSYDLIETLKPEERQGKKNSCSYYFGYPIIKPSKTWEGLQAFLSLQNIEGQYKITSAWTVP